MTQGLSLHSVLFKVKFYIFVNSYYPACVDILLSKFLIFRISYPVLPRTLNVKTNCTNVFLHVSEGTTKKVTLR